MIIFLFEIINNMNENMSLNKSGKIMISSNGPLGTQSFYSYSYFPSSNWFFLMSPLGFPLFFFPLLILSLFSFC